MAKEVLGSCPVCGKSTEVTRISCKHCGTTIEGRFSICRFCKLSDEQKTFIEIFIKCRGNIKEVEKELGVSYPTVKNRLEEVAAALGFSVQLDSDFASERKKILEKLNNGEITAEEAIEMLKEEV